MSFRFRSGEQAPADRRLRAGSGGMAVGFGVYCMGVCIGTTSSRKRKSRSPRSKKQSV
jgi:hypothetical protein